MRLELAPGHLLFNGPEPQWVMLSMSCRSNIGARIVVRTSLPRTYSAWADLTVQHHTFALPPPIEIYSSSVRRRPSSGWSSRFTKCLFNRSIPVVPQGVLSVCLDETQDYAVLGIGTSPPVLFYGSSIAIPSHSRLRPKSLESYLESLANPLSDHRFARRRRWFLEQHIVPRWIPRTYPRSQSQATLDAALSVGDHSSITSQTT